MGSLVDASGNVHKGRLTLREYQEAAFRTLSVGREEMMSLVGNHATLRLHFKTMYEYCLASFTMPYAAITIECAKLGNNVRGYILHRIDFKNLWSAFKDRQLHNDEEVVIFWSNHYKREAKLFRGLLPRLWVMVCHKGAYELLANIDPEPKLAGEARWLAMEPIVEWKPIVME